MRQDTKQELEEAMTALASTLHKCEKIQEGGNAGLHPSCLLGLKCRNAFFGTHRNIEIEQQNEVESS